MGAVLMLRDGTPVTAPYPFTMYQGVLLAPELMAQPAHSLGKLLPELTEALIVHLQEHYRVLSWCLHHSFPDIRGLQWHHYHEPELGIFQIFVGYTGLIEWSENRDFNEYLQEIRVVRRQEYKRALARGFSVLTSDDVDLMDRLHALTFERQGIQRSAGDVAKVRAITEMALKTGLGTLMVCRASDGVAASANLFLHDDHTGYYMFGANNPEYRNAGASSVLMIESLRDLYQRKFRRVDMVGVNSPQRGDFKTSFGARPLPYFTVLWKMPATAD